MIYKTTHPNENYTRDTNVWLGVSCSTITKLKTGGICSGCMMQDEVSTKLQLKEKCFSQMDYGNIQLRSKSILVH